ncbi:MAG: HD domain-containing protein [Treponema sp.]
MNTFKLLELKDSVYFTDDVYIDKKFLLFTGGTRFTQDTKRMLCDWQFTMLYTKGTVTEETFGSSLNAESAPTQAKDIADDKTNGSAEKKLSGETVEKIYNQFLAFTSETYNTYRTSQALNMEVILEKMKELCTFVQNNRQTVLILQAIMPYSMDDFLVTHSLRSTVFAIVVGMQLKLQNHQLTELATSCLMHEIGLTHIAEEIYTTEEKLSEEEKKYLYVHPVLSCRILKKAKFPLPICLGTLDHHERENGTGYPQKLTGEKISLYGKIIAVVCSYEAMIGKRKYREALEPASGLLNILRHDQSQYDEEVLQALLYALSFFPIGSFVYLSNNAVAQVIDNNSADPRFPIVRVIGKSENSAEAIRTDINGIRILRPARKDEWAAALGRGKQDA